MADKSTWLRPTLSSADMKALLMADGRIGRFMIRNSSEPNNYVLMILTGAADGPVQQYKITVAQNGPGGESTFTILNQTFFSLESIVDFGRNNPLN